MSQMKRKVFNIKLKSHIISQLESGTSNKELAKKYGVSHSTISNIWKMREKIKAFFDSNVLKRKRTRMSNHKNIEEALVKWFKDQRANNLPINGEILRQKANDFARVFGEDFVCSHSWINRFRIRHGITGGKMSRQSSSAASIDCVVEDWRSQTWPKLCEGYEPNDIFNADEFGLFYDMTPDRTLKFVGENCSGGEMSETRLTIMVAANISGSIKKKLLIVGKSKKPLCFNNCPLPITYENNVKSWMTSEIFERWLRNWDAELMIENNRKILLLVDNCSAHPDITNLECIKLVFLPSNVTSMLQPMAQTVIRHLKSHYRRLQMLNMIRNYDQESFTVIDAIMMLAEAWENVSQNIIANGFRGFKDPKALDVDDMTLEHVSDEIEEVNVSLAELAKNLRPPLSAVETKKFIDIDNSVATCAPAIEDDPLQAIKEENESDENSEDEFTMPTLNDGLNAVSVLRKMILCKEQYHIKGDYHDTLIRMQRELQHSFVHQNCSEEIKIEFK